MNPSFRDSKWLAVALLMVAGLALVVLTVANIEARFQSASRVVAGGAKATRNNSLVSLQDRSVDSAALDEEFSEPILDSDSIEERIRKKYGLVKRFGVWLPSYPLSASGVQLASLSRDSASGDKPQIFALPLYITTGRLGDGREGESYRAKVDAVGGLPPYVWTIERKATGADLTLDRSTGELVGNPGVPGASTIRIRVTDSVGAADVAEFSWRIAGIDVPESISSSSLVSKEGVAAKIVNPPSGDATSGEVNVADENAAAEATSDGKKSAEPLKISPLILDEATQGQPYLAQFFATGGTLPYAWSSVGVLPAGMSLSETGQLSGTPQEKGTYRVGVWVSDGVASVSQEFEFIVNSAPRPRITGLSGFISLRKIALSWINPTDSNVASVRILRQVNQPPINETDGFLVYEGVGQSALDPALPLGSYYYAAYAIGVDGAVSEPVYLNLILRSDADPYADQVIEQRLLHGQAYNATLLPNIVLGGPRGSGIKAGSVDVVSLGAGSVDAPGGAPYGGSIILGFSNNLVLDGPGHDFTVFENVFYVKGPTGYDPTSRFMEPAIVSVSQDGVTWHTYPFDFSPRFDPNTGALNLRHPYTYNRGFAGVNPVISNGSNVDPTDTTVSGGDSFDLADLGVPGLTWVRYIRLQATGHKWLVDVDGEQVHHINDSSRAADRTLNSAGFDLDAVTAIWFDGATITP